MPAKKPTNTSKKTTSKKSTSKKVDDITLVLDEIREKAFDIFNHRQVNDIPGDELSDWMQAEKEIRKKYNL